MRRNPKDREEGLKDGHVRLGDKQEATRLQEGLKDGHERLEVEEEARRLAGGAERRAREAGR